MKKINTKNKRNRLKIYFSILIFYLFTIIIINSKVYAINNENIKNTTRVYFLSEVTKEYGSGDCILLENYDSNGEKIYGLIDSERNLEKKDENGENTTAIKEFLKSHGVENLEFFMITHNHADHIGGALEVIDNFKINTLYIKEFDSHWIETSTNQETYENIIMKATQKNIKIVGVSYLSLTSEIISPNRTTNFINYVKNVDKKLFESFNEENTYFKFGSAYIKIYNWEMFDENGNQYITGVTNNSSREIVSNENNNSLALLLTQGNKKAFFTGDMNNLDDDENNGKAGDEDRLKDIIGKVDFLKIGHHGYRYSNTEKYINTLKPDYAVITNNIGEIYSDINNWLNENKVNYLYTTNDEYCVALTITENDMYLGFETTNSFKNVNGKIYYIPKGDKYKYVDYTKEAYKVIYNEKNVDVNSWENLKKLIEENKEEIVKIDEENKNCVLNKLIININSEGIIEANSTINIEKQQNIVLTSKENIKILRGKSLRSESLFNVEGNLSIGTNEMTGEITIDGNKENVTASSTLISVKNGTFNIFDNVILTNNMNYTNSITLDGTTRYYTSFGSAIYCKTGVINMYGGKIKNNSQNVNLTFTLPKEIKNYYYFSTQGSGIYLTSYSKLNMYGGSISDNYAENNAIVMTNSNYSISTNQRGINQSCDGVGIYANENTEVNLIGGEIINNKAINSSQTLLKKATDNTQNTNIHSLTNGIYGVGIYVQDSQLNISNNFQISNNNAQLNSIIKLDEDTTINTVASSSIRGVNGYITDSKLKIDSAVLSNGVLENNANITNEGKINRNGTGLVSTVNFGGGFTIFNCNDFNIENLQIKNCSSENGGGLYIYNSTGNLVNSVLSNNNALYGGGLYTNLSELKVKNTEFSNNNAQYGGGMYTGNTSSVNLNNTKIIDNNTTLGSGGGIYSQGKLTVLGEETLISNNTAKTYGGGIMNKNIAILIDGKINNNEAELNSGGGIRNDGKLIMNGGKIEENKATISGGGLDYSNGTFYYTLGTIEKNNAGKGNDIYPEDKELKDSIKPVLEINKLQNKWTNKDIKLKIEAYDNETSIKSISVNGQEIDGNDGIYEFIVTDNGTYSIIVKDFFNNECKKDIIISNIDKGSPGIELGVNGGVYVIEPNNNVVNLKEEINVKDEGNSGLNILKYQFSTKTIIPDLTDNNWKDFESGNELNENLDGGKYYLYTYVKDNAGNITLGKSNVYDIKYQVVYDANTGVGSMDTDTVSYGDIFVTKNNGFTKNGYEFTGWNQKSDGTGTSWTNWIGKEWKWTYKKSITLYAQWTPNTYTVTYDANGGTGKMDEDIATYDEYYTTKENVYKKEGYTFIGWNENKDETGVSWTKWIGKKWKWGYTKNVTLYAIWANLILNNNEITLDMSKTKTYKLEASGNYGTATYKSSDETVATVDSNGLVTAKSNGTCEIIVTGSKGNVKAVCSVKVESTYIKGDWDENKKVDVTDAYLLLTSISKNSEELEKKREIVDMNGDKKVDVTDAYLLLQLISNS